MSIKSYCFKLAHQIPALFAGYALAHVLFIIFLWLNHAAFPLNLEAMELTVLEHLKRVMSGMPLYPDPTPDFVALAYNPLYYFLAVPFAWIFGSNLFTLRLVAILGMLGAGSVIFLAVRRTTCSSWWGLMAVGLFAAAYRVMDTYLDNAHADSWLLFTVLLGCYLIDQSRSQTRNILGVLLMVSAFWFKQHGALFLVGALLYLTYRDGWQKSWQIWLLAIVLGPGLYLAAPTSLFGPRFHYFTWEVPRRWGNLNLGTISRLVKFIARSYFVLAIVACITSVYALVRSRHKVSIWYFMLPIAMLSGFMGALDMSNNNVFIPMGVWFIITGLLGLKRLTRYLAFKQRGLHLFALGASFLLLLYNPMSVIVPSQATAVYQDMVNYLKSLNGTVYAPWVGQLQDGYKLYPAVHWVPMEDMIRGPGLDERNNPTTRKLLEPVLQPKKKAYILHNFPLEGDILLAFLADRYVLDTDMGERFKQLANLPKRYDITWPRYLYRYASSEVTKK